MSMIPTHVDIMLESFSMRQRNLATQEKDLFNLFKYEVRGAVPFLCRKNTPFSGRITGDILVFFRPAGLVSPSLALILSPVGFAYEINGELKRLIRAEETGSWLSNEERLLKEILGNFV